MVRYARKNMKTLRKTRSLCPECHNLIDAEVVERAGKIYLEKNCPEHGDFNELYWGSAEYYHRFEKFAKDGKSLENPQVKVTAECPFTCGICKMHKSHSVFTNIVLTNRCDMNCWYCFFFAEKAGYVYEPTLEQIRTMLKNLKAEKAIPANAIQLTGGEPTLREDLVDIIRICKAEGFSHVQLNSNGLKISRDPEFVKNVREAGTNILYLSFDGVTQKTNSKNHKEMPKILENCRKAGLGITLVPTVINTVNDHELGNMLKYAVNNIDIIRSINFQPVSLVGRMPKSDREKYRITIPDVISRLETQLNGELTKEDFYPIPTVMPITEFIEALTNKPHYTMSSHFACGAATYAFIDDGKIVPLPRFLDIEGFTEYLKEKTVELKNGKSKYVVGVKALAKINSFIDKKKCPKDIKLGKLIFNFLRKQDYKSLGAIHQKSLFIGMMHFMDQYNYDVERVKRCCVHYVNPDGRIIPFCAFNVIPDMYRDKIQKKYGTPIPEWEKKNKRKLSDDLYRRI